MSRAVTQAARRFAEGEVGFMAEVRIPVARATHGLLLPPFEAALPFFRPFRVGRRVFAHREVRYCPVLATSVLGFRLIPSSRAWLRGRRRRGSYVRGGRSGLRYDESP